MTEPFLLDVSGGVAVVTLNRPERLNALLFEAYAALRDYFAGLRKDRPTGVTFTAKTAQ